MVAAGGWRRRPGWLAKQPAEAVEFIIPEA
jgi:hypothetical protein